MNDEQLQEVMLCLHDKIEQQLIHPEVHLLYDYIAPPGRTDRWAHLPTPEEISAEQPNACGWGTGMEDCAISGGVYLATLIDCYEITGMDRHADEARKMYSGLRTLARASRRKGFIPRGVLPDGSSHYPNSSVDQYTWYVYGMWRYYHSEISDDEEKGEIETIIDSICARIEADGFDILRDDGRPGLVSDIGVIRSDRSSRLLVMYLVGYDLTGNEHWLDIYNEKLKENDYARLRSIMTPSRVDVLPQGRQNVYAILQTQVSLIPLFELETDVRVKSCYKQALELNGKIVEDRLLAFREYDPGVHHDDYQLGGWRTGGPAIPDNLNREWRAIKQQCEVMAIMLLAHNVHLIEPIVGEKDRLYGDFLRDTCRDLLSTYHYDRLRTYAVIYAVMVYWLAVKHGLFEFAG